MRLSPVTLSGRHVRLEPLEPRHAADLERLGAQPDVWRYSTLLGSAGPAAAVRVWCETLGAAQARGELVAFAIVDAVRNEAVGGTTFFDYSEANRRVEIGYTWLAQPAWRTGINTEAKLLLMGHAFETLGCNRVQLKADARNERSRKAILRLGATFEGVLRAHMVLPDGWVRDTAIFSVVAAEWPGVKARLEGFLAR